MKKKLWWFAKKNLHFPKDPCVHDNSLKKVKKSSLLVFSLILPGKIKPFKGTFCHKLLYSVLFYLLIESFFESEEAFGHLTFCCFDFMDSLLFLMEATNLLENIVHVQSTSILDQIKLGVYAHLFCKFEFFCQYFDLFSELVKLSFRKWLFFFGLNTNICT